MAVLAVKTDRMDISVSLSSGYVFVQQKWRYNWIDESGTNPWTLQEKRNFHNRVDKWIWELWSSKAYAIIRGTRLVHLDLHDLDMTSHLGVTDSTISYLQIPVAHEFGHTFGNSIYALDATSPDYPMHGDEYKEPGLSTYNDDGSMMSVGNTVRQRHYDFLKIQLKNLINSEVEIYLF